MERLIFTIIAVPVLLLALFFLYAAPARAFSALASSKSREVRVPAKWLLAAWAVFVAMLLVYFVSGWWYRENYLMRPVDPLEVFELLLALVFGIHLPSVAYGRLRKARRTAV
jgi:hypothetical protein